MTTIHQIRSKFADVVEASKATAVPLTGARLIEGSRGGRTPFTIVRDSTAVFLSEPYESAADGKNTAFKKLCELERSLKIVATFYPAPTPKPLEELLIEPIPDLTFD